MFRSLLVLPTLFVSSLALIFAVESDTLASTAASATLVSTAAYTMAKSQNFTRAVIRVYGPGCSVGGEVDPNFLSSYNNARAAGFSDIDIYWYPCNGSSNNCKSYATQLSEISAILSAHSIKIGTLWITINRNIVGCLNWDYGPTGNIAQAQQLIAAVKATGFKFGISCDSLIWTSIFDSAFSPGDFILDNAAPLWFRSISQMPTITLGIPFGGWTTAVGQHYSDFDTALDGGLQIGLSVFTH
ncbi:glycoside hydrolase family 25 protein [Sphaerobolus stellatus SS14]|uniref:Glycoside hydrolase family 25 protein n=1 Tax=Sphaerobolus stellatus (strain SS14) TaxID=990650 RepID=A0A0C9TYV4_SPHS4|nr:glycoside hydrolase family 25 protein [Sphaerobolus stellatus SS14]